MTTLRWYLLREMSATVVVAVLVCTGLLLVGNLLKEILALLMAGQASLRLVFRGVGLLIPFVLAFALPMGTLTAALLVFGRLSADQELTAARANGISVMTLAFPVLLFCLGLCGICAWINLDLAPRCRAAYKQLFTEFARERVSALIIPGRFMTHFPGFVIYANRVDAPDPDGALNMEDVLFFQLRDGRKVLDIRAPRARLERREEEQEIRLSFLEGRALQWFASEVTETNAAATAEPHAGRWQPATDVGEITVRIPIPAEVRLGGLPELSDMTWSQLQAERRELFRLGIEEVTPLEVQLHRQAAFSFASLGFALVGIPLGVRGHRRETSVGVATSIGLVLLYYAFLIVAQAWETRPEMAPWLLVWMPNLLFQLTGAWLLWRVDRAA